MFDLDPYDMIQLKLIWIERDIKEISRDIQRFEHDSPAAAHARAHLATLRRTGVALMDKRDNYFANGGSEVPF